MSSPTPSSAIAAILDALLLARGFCLVIAVGPAGSSTLARWSLRARLQAASEEVIWHDLRTGELDVAAITERSTSGGPIILLAGLETLLEEERARCLASMNRRRDEWGAAAVRLVLWCEPRTVDAVWRHAPDLLHWRALLQVIEVGDLPVYDVESYLAWCVDAYRERSEDRVLLGSLVQLPEPTLTPRTGGPPGMGFATWTAKHRRSIIVRGAIGDPTLPVRAWCHAAARRRLDGAEDPPIPIWIRPGDIGPLSAGRIALGETPVLDAVAHAVMRDEHIVIVDDDGVRAAPPGAPDLDDDTPGRWVILSEHPDVWARRYRWPWAVVSTGLDARVTEPALADAIERVDRLLEIFSSAELLRFAERFYPALAATLPDPRASREALTRRLVESLLVHGQIDTPFFDRLRAMRPRHREAIDEVAELFVARSRFA